MTTRRQKRYLRRMEKREQKRLKAISENLNFDNVISLSSLYSSAYSSAKGVKFKASVQKYLLNLFPSIYQSRKALLKNKNICEGFIEFDISERGKTRHIRSVHFRERVIQKSLCVNALIPVMTRNLITDNGASQKGKGTHFSLKRLENHLRKHYRKYENKGYILLVDFKKYFDNINHDKLKTVVSGYFKDEKILKLSGDFINAFGDIGLGLGSETSQINAVVYLNKIDHWIKEKAKINCYGKYMDDSYFIHPEKEYLVKLLEKLTKIYSEYGVKLNTKKTCIIPIKQGFTFLKTRFFITDTGRIIKKPCRISITRERRKLKKQAILLNKGILTAKDIEISFASWLGSMKHRHARKTVYQMTKLYKKIIMEEKKNDE